MVDGPAPPQGAGAAGWHGAGPVASGPVVAPPWRPGPPPPRPVLPPGVPPLPGTQAGFGVRAGGYLLDNLVVQIVLGVAMLLGFLVIVVGVMAQPVAEAAVVSVFLLFMVLWLGSIGAQIGYEMLAGRRRGQTYGKQLVGTVVVDSTTGQPGIGVGRGAVRFLAKWLSGALFGLGYLWMLWDPNQRTLHDLMTGTTVVYAPREPNLSPLAYLRQLDVVPGERPPAP